MKCKQPHAEIFQPVCILFCSKELGTTSCNLMECVHQTLDIGELQFWTSCVSSAAVTHCQVISLRQRHIFLYNTTQRSTDREPNLQGSHSSKSTLLSVIILACPFSQHNNSIHILLWH